MKKEIAEKWVEALRSGEYKQVRGSLKEDGRYCCLGVICEINGKDKAGLKKGNALPSKTALKFFGLSYGEASALANMNDGGRSFKYIAKHIEKNWEDM